MPNIKPVSDLRNYTEVLRDIAVGEPVFLTKNGRGRYAIVDIEEYEKTKATLKLMGELSKGELARLREKALHDEASALRQAKDEGKSEGVAMVIEKMKASGMTEEQINAILSIN